jgi:nucleoside-diphosphate-sugar epimerase
MRAFVTGATGFTGGYLVRDLLARGYEVAALVRDPLRGSWMHREGVQLCEGDVRDYDAVREASRGADVAFHVAAAYREGGLGQRHYFEVNVVGSANVLNSCFENGVSRLVHCSTVGVHGETLRVPADEEAPVRPGDDYQRSKAQAEEVVWDGWRRACREGGPEVVVVRPTGIYGPGDTRLLKFFRMVTRRKPIPGNGNVLYHLTHVTDVVSGMILCATSSDSAGEAFIIAGPSWCRLRDWAAEIARHAGCNAPRFGLPIAPIAFAASVCEGLCHPLGVRPPLHRRSLDFFTKNRAFSWRKAARVLGYQPRVGMGEGIPQTVAWYRERGLL